MEHILEHLLEDIHDISNEEIIIENPNGDECKVFVITYHRFMKNYGFLIFKNRKRVYFLELVKTMTIDTSFKIIAYYNNSAIISINDKTFTCQVYDRSMQKTGNSNQVLDLYLADLNLFEPDPTQEYILK